ncbi:uncharacterized protein ACIQIH_006224 isoform 1-T2 [Cyanocitta cristata]
MVTYKGCFPGTFQEPHHVTGPAPAPPPRSRPAGADAPSRRPCHAGTAVAERCPAAPPPPPPAAEPRATRRWLLVMLQIEAVMAGGSMSFPVEHVTAGTCSRSLNWGISELDWRILVTQIV